MLKFLGGLLLVAVIVFVLGLALGWFGFSTSDAGVTINVNDEKIADDADSVRRGVQDIADGDGERDPDPDGDPSTAVEDRFARADRIVEGELLSADAREIAVQDSDGVRVTLPIPSAATDVVFIDGRPGRVADLRVGERVRVGIRSAADDAEVLVIAANR